MELKKREVLLKHELCSNCGICMAVKSLEFCPQIHIPDELYHEDPIGTPRRVILARSRLEQILHKAQDGGTVTTLAYLALKRGLAKYVIGCRFGKGEVVSVPEVICRPEDITLICGSKYTYTPVLAVLGKVKLSEGVCITGVPCQIRAVRLLETKIGISLLKIGILCSSNFRRELIVSLLRRQRKTMNDVVRMEVKRKFKIIFTDGSHIEISLSEAKRYTCSCCKQCPELIPRYSDIAVGSMFLPEKWNIVFVYSSLGEKLLDMAIEENLLEVKEAPQEVILKIREFAVKKQSEAKRFREPYLQVINQVR